MEEYEFNGESLDIVSDNVSKIKEIFPEVITEDKIDFDKLKLILGEDVDTDSERYNFTWPGKSKAIKEAQKISTGTLRPSKEESKHWDNTKNLYFEGDNLEVLKILQKSYNNKIKAIYIDPPYNTGKDFVYKDDYKDNLANYLEISGQTGNGKRLTTNTEADGRYHTNWLNMMYPRLKLARNLLKDDGVIFISIDDNEMDNLKKICDEIFGEENFIANINWHKKTQPSFLSKEVSNIKEYVLFYKKTQEKIATKGGLTDSNKLIEMINISNNIQERTLRKENVILKNTQYSGELFKGTYGTGNLKIELLNNINIINGLPDEDLKLKGRFKWSQEKMNSSFDEGDIYHIKNLKSLRPTVERKNKIVNVKPILDLLSKKLNDKIPTNTDATNELKKLFNDISPMDYPKPSDLIKYLVDAVTYNDKESIILDFFSGSATTAHALFKLNLEDKGGRKFLLVQIPEETDEKSEAYKAGYENICEIGKERIRRAGDKIVQESGNKELDIGFKVFKLDSSNLNKWNPDYENLEQSLLIAQDNIKPDRSHDDIIYEIMLDYGIDLTLPIEKYETATNTIYSIGFGALLICLDDKITKEICDSIIELSKDSEITRVVFKDNGFVSDSDKTNIKEILRINNIDEFITI